MSAAPVGSVAQAALSDEREAFEKFYRDSNSRIATWRQTDNLGRNSDGDYFIHPIPALWEAWQACAILATRQPAPVAAAVALPDNVRALLSKCIGPINIALAIAAVHCNADSSAETAQQCSEALSEIASVLAQPPAPAAPVDPLSQDAVNDDEEYEIDHGETVLRVQKALGITDTGWVSPDIVIHYLEKALAQRATSQPDSERYATLRQAAQSALGVLDAYSTESITAKICAEDLRAAIVAQQEPKS